jgi:hypothetical protein
MLSSVGSVLIFGLNLNMEKEEYGRWKSNGRKRINDGKMKRIMDGRKKRIMDGRRKRIMDWKKEENNGFGRRE